VLLVLGCALLVGAPPSEGAWSREYLKTVGVVLIIACGAAGAYIERVRWWKNQALLRKLCASLEQREAAGEEDGGTRPGR